MTAYPMSEPRRVVLDASIGVKWFKEEEGTREAEALLEDARNEQIVIIVPAHFIHEVISVSTRLGGPDVGERTWDMLRVAEMKAVPLGDRVVREAFLQCRALGCTFYDALSPAVARLYGATLYSADRRAHGGFEGVVLL